MALAPHLTISVTPDLISELKPGGARVIAGEPTRIGYKIVGLAKQTTGRLFRALGGPLGLVRGEQEADPEAKLEAHVDLHEFHPKMVADWARAAGFDPVRVRTEEFASGIFGWSVRTVEAMARPGVLPKNWPWLERKISGSSVTR